jgi:sterol desaturase/sphingolipid hydroxylase (fatty acid hydroxylase superfamily)
MIKEFAILLSYDIWFYLTHVALHWPSLYHIHKLHHKRFPITWMDTFEGHTMETVVQLAGAFFPLLVWEYGPWEIAVPLAFIGIRGLLRHDPRGSWLTGDHHILHHKEPNWNYGELWIDYLCGTSYSHRIEDGKV